MSETPMLDTIDSPADLRALPAEQLPALAAEIRAYLTQVVSVTGGHLASNLGMVELTLALHRVYDFASDRLVFDVGHQCYTHKLLTGRRDRFPTLRQKDGLTGFPNPRESEYDPFVVGHASTSISSAVGLAAGYRLQGEARKVVALVGDGAIGGGMCFEAMNHAGHAKEDVLVILNDNDMAIAETVGAFSTYLTDIRTRPTTHKLREDVHQALQKIPLIGTGLDWAQEHVLDALKGAIEAGHIFRALGFRYYGPLDGHDLPTLEEELRHLRELTGPKLLHIVTKKGEGFPAALADPETYHSAVPFEVRGTGQVVPKNKSGESWGGVFVDQLTRRAEEDERIVAITAAMPAGTGIKSFGEAFPDRFIDVGICEAHSVTFAAGLARAGRKPVVGIYSTFLQRGYDQIIHDVAVQPRLPIVFALDRAGLVGADGPTHHGVFDIAFLRHIPGLTLMAPRDGAELRAMLDWALAQEGPVAIRYPRGGPPDFAELCRVHHDKHGDENDRPACGGCRPIECGKSEPLRKGDAGTVFAYGRMVAPAFEAADKVADETGRQFAVVNARFAAPVDREAILQAAEATGLLVTVEDHVLAGGFGSAVAETLADAGAPCRLIRRGIPDRFVEHASPAQLDAQLGLDVDGLANALREAGAGK